ARPVAAPATVIRLVPRSLKVIVLLGLIGFTAALSVLNLVYHVPRAERAVEDDTRDRLFQELSRLQSSLEYMLLKADIEGARREVAVLAFNHDFMVAVLTDDAGSVIAATQRAWLGRPVAEVLPGFDMEEAARAARERQARISLTADRGALRAYGGILMGGDARSLRTSRAGRLFLEYDLRRAKARAINQVVNQSMYLAIWVTGLALALWIAFHFLLTRRTERLVHAAEQLAGGDLRARSGLRGDDELGRLGRAFDAMAQRVGDTQSRLQQDIAERTRTEEKLRTSEASYRTIFDAAEDAIFVFAIDSGAIVDANLKACITYGYSLEEIRRIDIAALSAGTRVFTQDDVMKLIARANAGEPLRFEWRRKSRSANLLWDEVSMKRVTIGGRDRILALTRDITDRKTAEAALRASEEQYRAMFNASIDGLALQDDAGRIVEVNPALRAIYGYGPDQDPGAFFGASLPPSFLQAVAAGDTVHAELADKRKDGSALDLEVHAVPMQYQGRPHSLTIARDITEKKRAAEELSRQREKVHQREKLAALGSLLAGVAHELNNPLSVVVARAVMLEERGDPATHAAAIKIRTAAERCARIVRTFLAMARQQPPARAPVQINDVVQAALDITNYTLRTSAIDVALDLAPDLPRIFADADQLHQVLMNLIVNAQQALQDRPLPRRLSLVSRYDGAQETICLTVSDNGPGIPDEVRPRIFEPYFTTKPTGVGTGVGLSVSLGIVESHGGTLTVDCPAEGGAVFAVMLPTGGADASSPGTDGMADQRSTQRSLLVVDDEVEVRETLAEILKNAGHRVALAASGGDALQRMAEAHFDVIVTDMRMPQMDGREFYREVERRWPDRLHRIAFVTGDTLTAGLREFAAECGRPVIEKPFLPGEVCRIVAEVGQ
ncbi:MAG: PAS domain S-box protein, partial [Rhodocyclaceae bacterium]